LAGHRLIREDAPELLNDEADKDGHGDEITQGLSPRPNSFSDPLNSLLSAWKVGQEDSLSLCTRPPTGREQR
jgi:hypothetical protein